MTKTLTTIFVVFALVLSGFPQKVTTRQNSIGQYPKVIAKTAFSNQTAAQGSTVLFAVTQTGTYRVNMYAWVQVAGTAGNVNLDVLYNNGTTGQSYGIPAMSVTATTNQNQATATLHCVAGTNISWRTLFNGITGSPAIAGDVIVERLN